MRAALILTVLLVSAACSREQPSATATIPPAEPRPAPGTAVETMVDERMITTAGSPAPATRTAALEELRISPEGIAVRPRLPRMHTVFRVHNQTSQPHTLRVSAGEIATTMTEPLTPGGQILMQLELRQGLHLVTCTIPGHEERAVFETYEPGRPPL